MTGKGGKKGFDPNKMHFLVKLEHQKIGGGTNYPTRYY